MSTQEQRQQWRELADAATPGEWMLGYTCGWADGAPYTNVNVETIDATIAGLGEQDECTADAAFIVAARAAVPALLADVDALTAERDVLRRLLESLTPGGSEFYDNPEACAMWARNRVGITSKIAVERNELRAERDALAAELAGYKRNAAYINSVIDSEGGYVP